MRTDLRENLKSYIGNLGVTIAFIARRLECKRQTLSNFKNGRTNLGEELKQKLQKFLLKIE